MVKCEAAILCLKGAKLAVKCTLCKYVTLIKQITLIIQLNGYVEEVKAQVSMKQFR